MHPHTHDITRLHQQGHSRNEIARLLEISTRQVDKAAREAGITFNQKPTRLATEARRERAHQQREALAQQARALAKKLLKEAKEADSTEDARKLAQAAYTAVKTDLELFKVQPPDSSDSPEQRLIEALRTEFSILQETDLDEGV